MVGRGAGDTSTDQQPRRKMTAAEARELALPRPGDGDSVKFMRQMLAFDPEPNFTAEGAAQEIANARVRDAQTARADNGFRAVIVNIQAIKGHEPETVDQRIAELKRLIAEDEACLPDCEPAVVEFHNYIGATALVLVDDFFQGHRIAEEMANRIRKQWKPGRGKGIVCAFAERPEKWPAND